MFGTRKPAAWLRWLRTGVKNFDVVERHEMIAKLARLRDEMERAHRENLNNMTHIHELELRELREQLNSKTELSGILQRTLNEQILSHQGQSHRASREADIRCNEIRDMCEIKIQQRTIDFERQMNETNACRRLRKGLDLPKSKGQTDQQIVYDAMTDLRTKLELTQMSLEKSDGKVKELKALCAQIPTWIDFEGIVAIDAISTDGKFGRVYKPLHQGQIERGRMSLRVGDMDHFLGEPENYDEPTETKQPAAPECDETSSPDVHNATAATTDVSKHKQVEEEPLAPVDAGSSEGAEPTIASNVSVAPPQLFHTQTVGRSPGEQEQVEDPLKDAGSSERGEATVPSNVSEAPLQILHTQAVRTADGEQEQVAEPTPVSTNISSVPAPQFLGFRIDLKKEAKKEAKLELKNGDTAVEPDDSQAYEVRCADREAETEPIYMISDASEAKYQLVSSMEALALSQQSQGSAHHDAGDTMDTLGEIDIDGILDDVDNGCSFDLPEWALGPGTTPTQENSTSTNAAPVDADMTGVVAEEGMPGRVSDVEARPSDVNMEDSTSATSVDRETNLTAEAETRADIERAAGILIASCTGRTSACTAEQVAEEITVADVPAIEAPATEASMTDAPAEETSIIEAPATETRMTEAPAAETQMTEAPAAETSIIEAPVAQAPASVEEPARENSRLQHEQPVTFGQAHEASRVRLPAAATPQLGNPFHREHKMSEAEDIHEPSPDSGDFAQWRAPFEMEPAASMARDIFNLVNSQAGEVDDAYRLRLLIDETRRRLPIERDDAWTEYDDALDSIIKHLEGILNSKTTALLQDLYRHRDVVPRTEEREMADAPGPARDSSKGDTQKDQMAKSVSNEEQEATSATSATSDESLVVSPMTPVSTPDIRLIAPARPRRLLVLRPPRPEHQSTTAPPPARKRLGAASHIADSDQEASRTREIEREAECKAKQLSSAQAASQPFHAIRSSGAMSTPHRTPSTNMPGLAMPQGLIRRPQPKAASYFITNKKAPRKNLAGSTASPSTHTSTSAGRPLIRTAPTDDTPTGGTILQTLPAGPHSSEGGSSDIPTNTDFKKSRTDHGNETSDPLAKLQPLFDEGALERADTWSPLDGLEHGHAIQLIQRWLETDTKFWQKIDDCTFSKNFSAFQGFDFKQLLRQCNWILRWLNEQHMAGQGAGLFQATGIQRLAQYIQQLCRAFFDGKIQNTVTKRPGASNAVRAGSKGEAESQEGGKEVVDVETVKKLMSWAEQVLKL
ncbi:hypothetical protein MMC13_006424 [Lambiella insularis]|nr:hypothetical protein [Lambiella insularis]